MVDRLCPRWDALLVSLVYRYAEKFKAFDVCQEIFRIRNRKASYWAGRIVLEFGALRHASLDLFVVIVCHYDGFELLRGDALAKALDNAIEQDLFDATLPGQSQFSVGCGREHSMEVIISVLLGSLSFNLHLPQLTHTSLGCFDIERKILGVDAIAVSGPSDEVLG
jgi:hypothetical protein